MGLLPESSSFFDPSSLFPQQQPPSIEAGIIGWPGDDDHADLGTSSNDGNTFVKVTLLRGKEPTADLVPGEGQGPRLYAQLSGYPFWCVPPRGSRCMVAFPGGFSDAPGAGVIVGVPAVSPVSQFGKTKAKLDVGADTDLIIKARSITLTMHNPDDGPEDFVSLTPESGIQLRDKHGNGVSISPTGTVQIFVTDQAASPAVKSTVTVEKDRIVVVQLDSGSAGIVLTAGGCTCFGSKFAAAAGNVSLGAAAIMPVAVGPQPGMVSTTVFAQS